MSANDLNGALSSGLWHSFSGCRPTFCACGSPYNMEKETINMAKQTMQELDDASLARCSAQGDHQAFAELVRRHQGPVAALIRRLVSQPDDAEDMFQETLVQAWLDVPSVRHPERFRSWLLQVARNRCRDHFKSADRQVCPTDERNLEGYVNRYGRAAPFERVAAAVEQAVRELSPKEREGVRFFYQEGLTIAEISARTQAPTGTVKSRLFTARHHLRRFLGVANREER